jgi:hypothetical protein
MMKVHRKESRSDTLPESYLLKDEGGQQPVSQFPNRGTDNTKALQQERKEYLARIQRGVSKAGQSRQAPPVFNKPQTPANSQASSSRPLIRGAPLSLKAKGLQQSSQANAQSPGGHAQTHQDHNRHPGNQGSRSGSLPSPNSPSSRALKSAGRSTFLHVPVPQYPKSSAEGPYPIRASPLPQQLRRNSHSSPQRQGSVSGSSSMEKNALPHIELPQNSSPMKGLSHYSHPPPD